MKSNKGNLIPIIISILLIIFFLFSINKVNEKSSAESHLILIDAINKAVVQCYAIEGYFPPDIEYLEENYGLIINHDKYIVSYNVFASNIMPNIDVFIR